jgi:hypothetical protein
VRTLADLGGQSLTGGVQLLPPRPRIAAFTAGEVGGEIFDLDLVSCPVGRDLLQGQAAALDHQEGVVAALRRQQLAAETQLASVKVRGIAGTTPRQTFFARCPTPT